MQKPSMNHYVPLTVRYLLFFVGAGWLMLNFLSQQEVRYLAEYQEFFTHRVAAVGASLLCAFAFMASDAAWKNTSRNEGAGGYGGAWCNRSKQSAHLDSTGDSGGGD